MSELLSGNTTDIRTVIVLGAGASAADGAPTQDALFHEYFKGPAPTESPRVQRAHEDLIRYFRTMFGINVLTGADITFPTFEEAIGLIDIALLRSEEFKPFPIESATLSTPSLRRTRWALVYALARAIAHTTKRAPNHRKLMARLRTTGHLRTTAFVDLNYDLCADNAIEIEGRSGGGEAVPASLVDYGFGRLAVNQGADPMTVLLYKPHGSLNWLFCRTCQQVRVTHQENGVLDIAHETVDSLCPRCGTASVEVIVPPTYYKDLSNVFLSVVWNGAERCLRSASHWIFCGYSFPDADMHFKYLLKRAQTNRLAAALPLHISVANEHIGKKEVDRASERSRYSRFFGPSSINYLDIGFQEFAVKPGSLVE